VKTSRRLVLLALLAFLPGCLVMQSGSLEVLNPKQAYGQSVAVIGDLHGDNRDIEQRLASDLSKALGKRGLTVAENPEKADIVIVPTLGRMRERAPEPVAPAGEDAMSAESEPVAAAEPVVASPAPEARSFHRFASAQTITRGDLVLRRDVPSARTPAGAQQAGLLLTGYRGEDFRDYGTGRRSLPPVWRIYVSQPAVQMKWNSVAVPLINAAAGVAKPLAKSGKAEKSEPRPETAETESRAEKKKEPERKKPENPEGSDREDDATTGAEDGAPEKKRKVFWWFGAKEKTER
jgi:hypothetical protein